MRQYYSFRLLALWVQNVARDPAKEKIDEEAKDEKRDEVRKTGHMILVSPSRHGGLSGEAETRQGVARMVVGHMYVCRPACGRSGTERGRGRERSGALPAKPDLSVSRRFQGTGDCLHYGGQPKIDIEREITSNKLQRSRTRDGCDARDYAQFLIFTVRDINPPGAGDGTPLPAGPSCLGKSGVTC